MIGTFKDVSTARSTKDVLDEVTDTVEAAVERGDIVVGQPRDRFDEGMYELLSGSGMTAIGPDEIEQFAYDVSVDASGNTITVRTNEIDVSAFLKVFIERGAKVEVFSTHDYPEE
jgi:hypothetical protein